VAALLEPCENLDARTGTGLDLVLEEPDEVNAGLSTSDHPGREGQTARSRADSATVDVSVQTPEPITPCR